MNEVDAWLADYSSALKPVIQRVRATILAADPRMTECIKWKAPTFDYRGPMATINPRARSHVTLLFHRGAEIPGVASVLEGDAALARTMRFASLEEVDSKGPGLSSVVRAWCDWREDRRKGAAGGQ